MNNSFWKKNMENVRKLTYSTCHNRKKKKLFGVRTKLSYCKAFHRKFVGKRNEKKASINEKSCLGKTKIW